MTGGKRVKRNLPRKKSKTFLTKKRKRDLIEYGELHPADNGDLESNKSIAAGSSRYKTASSRRIPPNGTSCAALNGPNTLKSNVQNRNRPLNDAASDSESSVDVDFMTQLVSTFHENNGKSISDVHSDTIRESDKTSSHKKSVSCKQTMPTKVYSSDDDLGEQVEESIEEPDNEAFEAQDDEEDSNSQSDPFILHFEHELPQDVVTEMQRKSEHHEEHKWPTLGTLKFFRPTMQDIPGNIQLKSISNLHKFYMKGIIIKNLERTLELSCKSANNNQLSTLQNELLSIASTYHDLFYPERNFSNGEEIRLVYCLHALNHVLKTRSRVLHHNNKLSRQQGEQNEYRDQGLTRTKVLIIVPFRESALRIVTMMTSLLCDEAKANVMNKKRFQDEYSAEEQDPSKKLQRPEDYEALFAGNIDDAFRIGLSITRKSLKLYADFYSADIIIASPLGLRTIIGAEGEKDRDYDFLSSIEIAIFDQADIFLMQNWEHVIHLMQHFHLQPQVSHECDFFRVRMWALNGWAKYYRQTLIFSSMMVPAIAGLYNKYCHNYAGKVVVRNPVVFSIIGQVIVQLPQVFHSFEASTIKDSVDERFNFFTSKILPNFTDSVMGNTLIFIPSYLDFVRVRNYFKKEEISCAQICEYTKHAKVAKARDLFFHGHRHFLLYTERFHFFRRYRIKGIKHIIFYQLPIYSHYYSEMCNLLHRDMQRKITTAAETTMSCTVLYCRYDAHLLAGVVGDLRTTTMLNSETKVHMFVTGES